MTVARSSRCMGSANGIQNNWNEHGMLALIEVWQTKRENYSAAS